MTCKQKLLGYNRFTLVSSLTLITQDFELFITIKMINGRRGIFSLSSPDRDPISQGGSMGCSRDPSHRVGPWTVPEIHLTGWVHGLFQRSISQGGSMVCSRDPSHRMGPWALPEIPSQRMGPWALPEIHLTGWVHELFQRSISQGGSMGSSRDPSHTVVLWAIPEIHLTGWVHGVFQRSISQNGSMDCSRDPISQGGSMDCSRDPSHRVGSMVCSRDPSHRMGPWALPEIHLKEWVHGLFQRSISQGGSMSCSRDPSHRVGPWALPEIHLTR